MKLYPILLLALLVAACSEKEHQDVPKGQMKGNVYFNDYESEVGWGDCQHKSISSRYAHSGKHSIQVDNDNPYGMGFQQPLGKMIGRKPKKSGDRSLGTFAKPVRQWFAGAGSGIAG